MSISNCLGDVACRQKDTTNGLRKESYYFNQEQRGRNKSHFHVLYLTGVIIHQWRKGLNC